MRGTFFAKPFEVIVETSGERWSQGDTLAGRLTIRNRGSAVEKLESFDLRLCRGQFSAVKKKAENAFKPVAAMKLGGELAPGAQLEREFCFELGWNAPITDSVSSLFLVCGSGSLEVAVEPAPVIRELVAQLVAQQNFGFKSWKFSKNSVEARLSAPAGRSFATLDHLLLHVRFTEESGRPDLEVAYQFEVKKVDAAPASLRLEKGERLIRQIIPSADYLTPSGRVNFELLASKIEEAIATVRAKVIF